MKDNLSIAVIIPVYNVRERLVQCVNSLVEQTITNYTIYLIDDGSTDGSEDICDELSTRFEGKVVTFHKKNGGVSDARNFGINHTTSDLVAFVDPDDYVVKYYLENLYTALINAKADIACCDFQELWEGDVLDYRDARLKSKNMKIYSSTEALETLLYQRQIDFAVWGKLFKRALFKGIEFPVGKRYEDVPVTLQLFAKSKDVVIYNLKDYVYWQRKEGMMNSSFRDTKLDIIEMMDEMMRLINTERPSLIEAASCRYFAGLSNVYFQIPKSHIVKRTVWRKMKSVRKTILFDGKASKKVKIGVLLSYLGSWPMEMVYSSLKKKSGLGEQR